MNSAAANSPAPDSPQPAAGGWPVSGWIAVLLLAFTAHVGFIMTFGEIKPAAPRIVANVPKLRLANREDELVALNDPTLFARPQRRDFSDGLGAKSAGEYSPPGRQPAPPRWLTLPGEGLGAALGGFLRTNGVTASRRLDFKPAPELSEPELPAEPALAQNSTMRVEGELARRQLPLAMNLTNLAYPDVLAPCVVQVLVDAAGNVISAVVLPPENALEAAGHSDAAGRRALEFTRALRFAPSTQLTVGRVVFNWHTVPPATNTNERE